MGELRWFLHMDRDWMWRWFLTNADGQPFAMSKSSFFCMEEAARNRDAAQMAMIGL